MSELAITFESPVLVALAGVDKFFGATAAVSDLSFQVRAGEVYGLLGPNGAGKSTALRILAGLLRPSAGKAHVCNIDPAIHPEAARAKLGFLTGTTGLYERLTAREVLSFFGRISEMPESEIQRRIVDVTAALDLGRFLDRRCGGLSTGERQRVSVARALLANPPVLVLDEPTSGLDVLASRYLRELVARERGRGKAIIFSTHYLTEADLLCDRVGLLHQGRLLTEGTPQQLREATGGSSLEESFLKLIGAQAAS